MSAASVGRNPKGEDPAEGLRDAVAVEDGQTPNPDFMREDYAGPIPAPKDTGK